MNEEKKLNKKGLFVAILVILVIIGGWFIFFGENKTQPLTTEEEISLQQEAEDIIQTGDIRGCDKIDNKMYRSVCRNNVALELAQKNLDIKECQNLDNVLIPREECERQVIFEKSIKNEDVSVCSETSSKDLKNECEDSFYLQVALKNNDAGVCGSVSDLLQQNICRDEFVFQNDFTKNVSTFNCELFTGNNFKNDCKNLKDLVGREGVDPSVCTSFTTSSFTGLCRVLSNNFLPRNNK